MTLAVAFWLAFLLGMRHAFDADHILAIDNVTRMLTQRGARRPWLTGGWFALGHSTIVVLAAVTVALGASLIAPEGGWVDFTGVWGPLVSSLFLLAVAGFAVFSAVHMLRTRRANPHTHTLAPSRFSRQIGKVRRPSMMYPVGFAFGLGFDTATEISLLALAAATADPWVALGLALTFAVSMATLDTAQSLLASRAYRRPSAILILLSAAGAVAVAFAQLAELVGLPAPDVSLLGIAFTVVLIAALAWQFVRTFGHARQTAPEQTG